LIAHGIVKPNMPVAGTASGGVAGSRTRRHPGGVVDIDAGVIEAVTAAAGAAKEISDEGSKADQPPGCVTKPGS
jgi:hypothetical protein